MNIYCYILLAGLGLMVQCAARPVLQEMMSKVLGPDNPLSNALDATLKQAQATSRELQLMDSPRSSQQPRTLESGVLKKTPRSAGLPPLLRAKPLTPLEINRGFGQVLSVVSILGQVDSYIAERARALVRKLLLLVDEDTANQIAQY